MIFRRKPTFQSILDECLAALEGGEALDSVLDRYPDQRDDLRPLLETARQVGGVPPAQPRVFAHQAGLQRFLGELIQPASSYIFLELPVPNARIELGKPSTKCRQVLR